LKHCASKGRVIVGLNSDDSVKGLKGPSRPYNDQEDRKIILEACRYVDEVIIFNEQTPYNLIKSLNPDIIVKGGDYVAADVVGNDIATIDIFNYIEGYSTTSTLEKIK
jgi:D-beta-D-heptose 7-phosphate kinase/D-beta-D-heptose 1-phosphate adenosyltransferase